MTRTKFAPPPQSRFSLALIPALCSPSWRSPSARRWTTSQVEFIWLSFSCHGERRISAAVDVKFGAADGTRDETCRRQCEYSRHKRRERRNNLRCGPRKYWRSSGELYWWAKMRLSGRARGFEGSICVGSAALARRAKEVLEPRTAEAWARTKFMALWEAVGEARE